MALLNFPVSPVNGQIYPSNPVIGEKVYQWLSTEQTWSLQGSSTGVTPGCYGDAYNVPSFCVDAVGRVTFAENVAIAANSPSLQQVTTRGAVTTDTVTVGGLVAAGLTFPVADGAAGEYLTTDGVGNLSWVAGAADVPEAATLAEAAAGILNTAYSTPETAVPKDAAGMGGAAILPNGTAASAPAGSPGYARIANDSGSLTFYANGAYFPVGYGAGGSIFNTAVGLGTLAVNTGSNNVAVGNSALAANTSGGFNVATGAIALCSNTIGARNTASGSNAMRFNTTGCENTATGYYSLRLNTTGGSNTAIGAYAMCANTTGSNNVAYGYCALSRNTTGGFNTALGWRALCANISGTNNVAVGINTLLANVACSNTAVGRNALVQLSGEGTASSCNTAIGSLAGCTHVSGCNNIFIGSCAFGSITTASNEVTVGNSSNDSYRIFAAGWSNVSDARDKDQIEALPLGLEFVKALEPRKFVWSYRDGSSQNGNPDIGFIAQEVLAVQEAAEADYAGLVNSASEEQLMLISAKFTPILVNAIKELATENEALKARLDAAGL